MLVVLSGDRDERSKDQISIDERVRRFKWKFLQLTGKVAEEVFTRNGKKGSEKSVSRFSFEQGERPQSSH